MLIRFVHPRYRKTRGTRRHAPWLVRSRNGGANALAANTFTGGDVRSHSTPVDGQGRFRRAVRATASTTWQGSGTGWIHYSSTRPLRRGAVPARDEIII